MARLLACSRLASLQLVQGQPSTFHTASTVYTVPKLKPSIQDCYALLGVAEECGDAELKDAYIKRAKTYHPDSGSSSADSNRFIRMKEAYKAVLEHRKGRELREEEEKEAEVVFDIRHTAPQHRQYLEFEGVGAGTPSQRQRQYQQYRVKRVTENIFQHRIQRQAAATEDALVLKDKQQAKKTIISNAIERLCEDMIQESMQRGEFDNLSGQGKPLAHLAHNPFVDTMTHNLNKILVNNGFAPEWIMLQSEIRSDLQHARQRVALMHQRMGTEPLSAKEVDMRRMTLERFKIDISEVNSKIQKFNLIVPFLDKQKMPYKVEQELKKIKENVDKYLPKEEAEEERVEMYLESMEQKLSPMPQSQPSISWWQVWRDIRSVFRSSPAADLQPELQKKGL